MGRTANGGSVTSWTANDIATTQSYVRDDPPELVTVAGRVPWLYLWEGGTWSRWDITAGADEDDPALMTLINEAAVGYSSSEASMGRQIKAGASLATPRWAKVIFTEPWPHEAGGLWCENGEDQGAGGGGLVIIGGEIVYDDVWFNGGVIPAGNSTDTKAEIYNRKGRLKNCGVVFIEGLLETGECKFEDWDASGALGSLTEQNCWKGDTHVIDERGLGGNGHGGGDGGTDLANSSPGGPPVWRQHRVVSRTEYQGNFAQATRGGAMDYTMDFKDVTIEALPTGPWGNSSASYRGLWYFNDNPGAGINVDLTFAGCYADRTALAGGVDTDPTLTVNLNGITPVSGSIATGPDPRGYPIVAAAVGVGYSWPAHRNYAGASPAAWDGGAIEWDGSSTTWS